MSSRFIKVLAPPNVVMPRGAAWAANAALWLARAWWSVRPAIATRSLRKAAP